jgi:hypothetical protein
VPPSVREWFFAQAPVERGQAGPEDGSFVGLEPSATHAAHELPAYGSLLSDIVDIAAHVLV